MVCTGRFDKPADVHHEKREGIESRDVTIAVPLNENSTAVGKIFAYLPVRSGTGFPFLINADFILPSSREDIQDVPWNRNWLMDCVADLISKELLPLLKEQKFLNIGFLEALASELNNLAKDENNLFYPIFSRLRETFMNEELLHYLQFTKDVDVCTRRQDLMILKRCQIAELPLASDKPRSLRLERSRHYNPGQVSI